MPFCGWRCTSYCSRSCLPMLSQSMSLWPSLLCALLLVVLSMVSPLTSLQRRDANNEQVNHNVGVITGVSVLKSSPEFCYALHVASYIVSHIAPSLLAGDMCRIAAVLVCFGVWLLHIGVICSGVVCSNSVCRTWVMVFHASVKLLYYDQQCIHLYTAPLERCGLTA